MKKKYSKISLSFKAFIIIIGRKKIIQPGSKALVAGLSSKAINQLNVDSLKLTNIIKTLTQEKILWHANIVVVFVPSVSRTLHFQIANTV